MVECTIFLSSDIKAWSYSRELKKSPTSDNSYLRTLSLDAELEYQGFIDRQGFHCLIVCSTDTPTVPAEVIGCLELNKKMVEENLPANASLEITVSEEEFSDLKDCLMHTIDKKHTQVRVNMVLQGVQKEPTTKCGGEWHVNDEIKHVEGRSLKIKGFSWALHCREH